MEQHNDAPIPAAEVEPIAAAEAEPIPAENPPQSLYQYQKQHNLRWQTNNPDKCMTHDHTYYDSHRIEILVKRRDAYRAKRSAQLAAIAAANAARNAQPLPASIADPITTS